MKNAKIITAFALILSLCLCLLAGCAGGRTDPAETAAPDADLLAKIEAAGVITIAMEGTWAPWTYHDETDTLVGYDVEVGQKLAEKLGVEAQFIEGEWDGLLAGRIDATLNAEVTFYDYLKAHPDADVKIAAIDPDETSVAIPMRKGEETVSLLAAVNDALAQMRADGTLTALSEKYFGTDISGSDR